MEKNFSRIKVKEGDTEIEIEGDKTFVKNSLNEVRGIIGISKVKTEGTKSGKKRGRKKKPGRKPKRKPKKTPKKYRIDLRSIPLKHIFELKNPKRKRHHVLIMAFYMNKALRKREFRATDLESLYGEVDIDPPKNLSYFLRSMSSEDPKLVEHGKKKGRYKITQEGIDYIYDEIPDA